MTKFRPIPDGAIAIDLPNTSQLRGYTCGPSALMSVLAFHGVGPEHERELAIAMGIDRTGADPRHVVRALRRYGLAFEEFRPMATTQLTACLDRSRPVMITLQAWGGRANAGYAKRRDSGHWIVAIGHDSEGVYFEDPYLYRTRGFLTFDELAERWHDVEGTRRRPLDRYGIAIWRDAPRIRRARAIE